MAQEKKERARTTSSIFTNDIMAVISHQSNDETTKSALAINHLSFGTSYYQTNRILAKLAQFAAEGKIAQVAKLLNIRPDLRIEVLFTLAGLGAQDEMKAILIEHPEDLLVSHRLRDISGAEFPSITLLQHAIWTKDVRYMVNMMLDCLPKNALGEQIRLKLVEQYKELMANGVVYYLHGEKHADERHFNLQPLLTGLSTYVKNYDKWTDKERELYWCTKVGLAHKLQPAIIRYHYCDPDESFWDKPDFKKPKLKRSLEIYNWVVEKVQLWSESLVGLGSDFGIHSASSPAPSASGQWRLRGGLARAVVAARLAVEDFDALTALDEVRTKIDMPLLTERLHTPIQNLEDNLDLQKKF